MICKVNLLKTMAKGYSGMSILLSLIFTAFLLCQSLPGRAQGDLDVAIEILPPYPIQIEYYINNAENVFVNITNLGSSDKSIYLHAAIIGDNGLMASTKESFRPLSFINIPAFQTLFLTGVELANTDMGFSNLGNLNIQGVTPEIQDLIYVQRVLPAGNYQICITALDWDTGMALQQTCSSEFTIYDASSPLIYQPIDGEVIEPNLTSNVQFAWWPPFTGSSTPPLFKYRLKIIDITDEMYSDLDLEMNNPGRQIIMDRDFIQDEFYMFDMTSAGIELDTGGLYAVRVRAEDMNGAVPVANSGYSEVITFRYGEITEGEEEEEPESGCDGYCEYELQENQTATTSIAEMDKLKIGFFEVQDLFITNSDGSAASGTGRIAISFLDSVQINVQFDGVKVNSSGRIFEGDVTAITDYDYDPNDPTSLSAWHQFVRTERLISTLLGGRGRSLNLPVGMTYNVSGENFMLGFTQATFSPDRARCQVMHALNVQNWGENFISLSASDICLLPDGFGQQFLMHPPADIQLPDLFNTEWFLKGSLANDELQVKEEATFMAVDCQGIAEIGINIEVLFSEDLLVPATTSTDKVKGTISAYIPRQPDSPVMGSGENLEWGFIGALSIEPFQLKGFPELNFHVNEAWGDISDTRNPNGMIVPENYQGPDVISDNGVVTLDPIWEGFYLKSIQIRGGDDWPVNGINIDAAIENWIIDPLVSGQFLIKDLATTSGGNFDFSVDTIYADLVQWSHYGTGSWELGIKGAVGIPLTSAADDFRYSTILLPHDGSDATDIELIIQSPGGVTFPVMGNATANLCPNSYIRVATIDQENILDTHLAGNMSIGITTPVSFTIPWIDFHIGYHSEEGFTENAFSILGVPVNGEEVSCASVPIPPSIAGTGGHSGIDTGGGSSSSSSGGSSGSGGGGSASGSSGSGGSGTSSSTSGTGGTPSSGTGDPLPPPPGASDAMGMNNFPIELKEISLEQWSPEGISFNLDPSVDILGGGQNGFGIDVNFKVNTDFNPGTKKYELGSNAFDLGSIHLRDVNAFGINLDGYVEFYNEEPAKGARGALSVDLPIGIDLDLAADFGVVRSDPSVEFGSSHLHYGYWYVDGMIGFAQGIPLAPGVGLHGLGGGVYVNMERHGSFDQGGLDATVQSEVDALLGDINFNGTLTNMPDEKKPTPKFGTYGLKLATRLATTVPSALNMDVNISGTFAQGIGINSLGIYGNAYVMSPLDKREQANLWAFAELSWNKIGKSDHQFNGNIALFANVAGGVLKGSGAGDKVVDVSFEANTKTGKWFFKAGEPTKRAGLEVSLVLSKLNANGYFMFGHDMPTTLPVPSDVERILGNASSNSKDGNKLDNQNAFKGSAIGRSLSNTGFYEDGEGIAFGLEASVEFNLQAWALYASLEAFLGFDINLTRQGGGTCYVANQGQIAPGINDWYATGQIYAGFEGAMGLKGKFLGKEYNWELFSMGAAMIIDAGGPNPTWAEGRAGVYYKLLNGALKGHANFDLSVGDKCILTDDSGMIPIVYKLTPEDGETDVSIFESRRMLAAFYVPVNEDIVIPHLDYMGRSVNKTVRIYVDDFTVESSAGTWDINDLSQTWSTDKKSVTFDLNSIFLERTDYTIKLTMKAEEKINGQYKPYKINTIGPIWPGETHTHSFSTGEAPYPIDDSEILSTIPIRRQRFFMQEEMNNIFKTVAPVITFRQDLKSLGQSDYFPSSTDKHKYTYYLRWQDLSGGDPIIQIKNYGEASSVRVVVSDIPQLLPATIYSCQLIRKTERIFNNIGPDGEELLVPASALNLQILDQSIKNLAAVEDSRLSASDTLTANITMDPGQFTEPGEDIIYQFYFRTSKYNTLSDKVAATSTSFENIETNLTDYPKVVFTMDERFDVFDMMGYFDDENPSNRLIAPRVHIGAELNGNPAYYNSQFPPEIYTQDPYNSRDEPGILGTFVSPGQPSYNNFLNYSLIGFTNLYEELSASTHNVLAQKTSGSGSSTLQLQNQSIPAISGLISRDYTQDIISFSFGDAEIEGYLGPLSDQNIENAINSFSSGLTSLSHSPILDASGKDFVITNPGSSTFKVAYKMPYWVFEDISYAIASGDRVLSKSTSTGTIEIPPIRGGGGDIIDRGGDEPTIGTGNIPQILSTGGPNSEMDFTNYFDYHKGNLYESYMSDLTFYNIWTHYLDKYYPAFQMQLDNMGLISKKMQFHKGNYKMIISPDRGWLPMSTPTTSAAEILSFNYNPLNMEIGSHSSSNPGTGGVYDGTFSPGIGDVDNNFIPEPIMNDGINLIVDDKNHIIQGGGTNNGGNQSGGNIIPGGSTGGGGIIPGGNDTPGTIIYPLSDDFSNSSGPLLIINN